VLIALDHAAAGAVFNISSAEVLPIRHIVDQVAEKAGISATWRKRPLALAMTVAGGLERFAAVDPCQREPLVTRYALGLFAYEQGLNVDKASDQLGWTPQISFAEGLRRTFVT
jgi:nucleoside-diphosphate-sugar epimerase